MMRLNCIILFILLWFPAAALAQDAVPLEILGRTFCVKIGGAVGTAFTIDYKGKLYLVTARHMVAGIPDSNAVIQVRRGDNWEDYRTIKTLYPSSKDVDIAVFETTEKVPQPFQIAAFSQAGGGGITLGQSLWFIGYPFGLGSSNLTVNGVKGTSLPFMKRGSMSAIDGTNSDAVVYYIDGFNNPGFSGGPIVFWDFTTHKYEILGVVKGYKQDTAKTIVNEQEVDVPVLVNSGILVAYGIKYAIDAIENSLQKQP